MCKGSVDVLYLYMYVSNKKKTVPHVSSGEGLICF